MRESTGDSLSIDILEYGNLEPPTITMRSAMSHSGSATRKEGGEEGGSRGGEDDNR